MYQYKVAPKIETDRLIIRIVNEDDFKDFYEFCSDEKVCTYLTFNPYKSLHHTKKIINNMINAYIHGTDVNFSVVLKNNYKVIGSISLSFKNEGNYADVGYLFNSSFWGKGYADEALKAIIQIAFKYYNLDYLLATYVNYNISSKKLLEKNGFQKIIGENKTFIKNGKTFDLIKAKLDKNML